MMKVKTLFFGITTDLVGASHLVVAIQENTTVADFKIKLKSNLPQLVNLNSYAIAINEEYANDKDVLNDGDVVAIIPPVSGG